MIDLILLWSIGTVICIVAGYALWGDGKQWYGNDLDKKWGARIIVFAWIWPLGLAGLLLWVLWSVAVSIGQHFNEIFKDAEIGHKR